MNKHNVRAFSAMLICLFFFCSNYPSAIAAEPACKLTPYDEIGPMYLPDSPERATVGRGYVLAGTVRSYPSCAPIAGARIEFWLAGPNGQYDAAHRGTIHADKEGRYRIETDFPPPYVGRPPHIHFMITAAGHERLITQHYPAAGTKGASFDFVLETEKGAKVKDGAAH